VSTDPHFERSVLAEFQLRERCARRRDRLHVARLLAQKLHRDRRQALARLRRVAHALPGRFRAVAWFHHAHQADVTGHALAAAGLTEHEVAAVRLFDAQPAAPHSVCNGHAVFPTLRVGPVSLRAAIEDRLEGPRPSGENLSALRLLADPGSGA
jgi:hypothetical protein